MTQSKCLFLFHPCTTITILLGILMLVSAVESFQATSRILSSNKRGHHAYNRSRQKTSAPLQMSTTDASFESKSSEAKDDEYSSASKDDDDDHNNNNTMKKKKNQEFAMPWSDLQNDALRDSLSKYTIRIPLKNRGGYGDEEQTSKVFCLWRTMLKEVPEIAGYPIDFLQEMHASQIERKETLMEETPGLLPYLEDYAFATAGGVSGAIFGVPGLADGTRIQTSAVSNIEVTLPQGFVRTADGSAAYEVGKPRRREFATADEDASLLTTSAEREALETGGELLKSVQNAAGGSLGKDGSMEEGDAMLARLGASTAILLAGATAVNLLSHHLTVNVFWV